MLSRFTLNLELATLRRIYIIYRPKVTNIITRVADLSGPSIIFFLPCKMHWHLPQLWIYLYVFCTSSQFPPVQRRPQPISPHPFSFWIPYSFVRFAAVPWMTPTRRMATTGSPTSSIAVRPSTPTSQTRSTPLALFFPKLLLLCSSLVSRRSFTNLFPCLVLLFLFWTVCGLCGDFLSCNFPTGASQIYSCSRSTSSALSNWWLCVKCRGWGGWLSVLLFEPWLHEIK